MPGGRPYGSKQRKPSICSLEALRPKILKVLNEWLDNGDKIVALKLLEYTYPKPVAENVSDESEYKRISERFADAVVQTAGAGRIPSDDSEVQE